MNSNCKLYIRPECEWKVEKDESGEYIRIFDWIHRREILLTCETHRIWELIDQGYNAGEIIHIMEDENISPDRVENVLNELIRLDLITAISNP